MSLFAPAGTSFLHDTPALTRRPRDRNSTAPRRLRPGCVRSAGRAARRLSQAGSPGRAAAAPGRRHGFLRPPFPPPLTRGAHVNFLAGRTRPPPFFVSLGPAAPRPAQGRSPPRYLGPPGPRPPPPAALPRSCRARRARGGGAEGRGGRGRASGGRSAVPGGFPRRPAGRGCPSYSRRGTWIEGSAGTWRGRPTCSSSAPTGAGCSSPASTATVSSGDGARSHPLPRPPPLSTAAAARSPPSSAPRRGPLAHLRAERGAAAAGPGRTASLRHAEARRAPAPSLSLADRGAGGAPLSNRRAANGGVRSAPLPQRWRSLSEARAASLGRARAWPRPALTPACARAEQPELEALRQEGAEGKKAGFALQALNHRFIPVGKDL